MVLLLLSVYNHITTTLSIYTHSSTTPISLPQPASQGLFVILDNKYRRDNPICQTSIHIFHNEISTSLLGIAFTQGAQKKDQEWICRFYRTNKKGSEKNVEGLYRCLK